MGGLSRVSRAGRGAALLSMGGLSRVSRAGRGAALLCAALHPAAPCRPPPRPHPSARGRVPCFPCPPSRPPASALRCGPLTRRPAAQIASGGYVGVRDVKMVPPPPTHTPLSSPRVRIFSWSCATSRWCRRPPTHTIAPPPLTHTPPPQSPLRHTRRRRPARLPALPAPLRRPRPPVPPRPHAQARGRARASGRAVA